MRIERYRLDGNRPGDEGGQPCRNCSGPVDAHEIGGIVEQLTLCRVGTVHGDEGATYEFRWWEPSEMNQRTSRVGHMYERQAVRSLPDHASRPISKPGNVLVGEHFAWSA